MKTIRPGIRWLYSALTLLFAWPQLCLAEENSAVTLRIETDATLKLTTGPHSLDAVTRDRYFRLYHFPGMYQGEVAATLRQLNLAPGRGTGPYFGDDGGDTLRYGRADTAEGTITAFVEMAQHGKKEHPGSTYAAAGGSFPKQAVADQPGNNAPVPVDPTMKVAHNRAVAPAQHQAAADLLVTWLDRLRSAGAPPPAFFSPVNEPDAGWKSGPSSSLDHAQFVREVALRLRESHPEVRISGPCTAWPYPGENWKRWEASGWERSFIETTGDVVGAYDFHLYTKELWAYGKESPGFRSARKMPTPNLFASLPLGHSEIMEFGKSDVLLDLVQALHLAKWGKPAPPVIISEFGRQGITPQLGPWANDYLYYLYSTTVTRLWMKLMDRPEVALTVPFILPESDPGYGPKRGQALATRPGAPGDLQTTPTPLASWLAIFRDLAGTRLPTYWENASPALARGLFAIACRNATETFVLVHNATPQPLPVTLALASPESWPKGVKIARTKWEGSLPADHLTPTPPDATWRRDGEAREILDTPRLLLAGEETALIRIPNLPEPTRQVVVSRLYAPEFLQTLQSPTEATFTFQIPPEMLKTATRAQLVLGFASPQGPQSNEAHLLLRWDSAKAPTVAPLDLSEGWRQVAIPVTVPVPLENLPSGSWKVRVSADVADLPTDSRIVSARLDIQNEMPISPPSSPE